MLCEETIEGTGTNGKRFRLSISPDNFPESPREWDNLGTFLTWERRYNSPDENPFAEPENLLIDLAESSDVGARVIEYWGDEIERSPWNSDREKACIAAREKAVERFANKNAIILPVYRYEHGGVAYSTAPFSCPWDSGQAGYIYVPRETALRELGAKILTRAGREKIEGILRAEVNTYSQYANGEVCAYTLEEEGEDGEWEVRDSMGGIYDGDLLDNIPEEYRAAVAAQI